MALFYCVWDDAVSFLVDAKDKAHAIAAATEEDAEGNPPDQVWAVPVGVFGAYVEFDDGGGADDGSTIITVDVVEHTHDALCELEDRTEVDADPCDSEAEKEDGAVVRCTLPAGHDMPHLATGLRWEP